VRARIAASIVLAVAVAFGTAGCGFITPQSTDIHYDASDGVSGNVGDIGVRNAMIISENGKTGNLVLVFVNSDTRSHVVEIQRGSGAAVHNQFVNVPGSSSKKLGERGERIVIFNNLHSIPGSLYPVYFQYGNSTGLRLLVPVLDGALPGYAQLLPSVVAPPKPKPIPTAAPGPVSTPTATPAG
jgi:hypothetical protein